MFFLITNITVAQLCGAGTTTVVLLDSIKYAETQNWQLEFEDDFNGNTLDLAKWKADEGGELDGTGAYKTIDNVTVSPETFYGERTSATGVCLITVKKETVTKLPVSWNPAIAPVTYNYTGANVGSIPEFGWGKYEIRCKLPKGKSLWPAFWMYGEKNGAGDEIDVFEFMNEYNILGKYDAGKLCKVDQMHYHKFDKRDPNNNVDHNCGISADDDIDYSLDFHRFTIIWNRWGVYWYVDGEFKKEAAQWYNTIGEAINLNNIRPSQVVFRNDWFPKNPMTILFSLGVQHGKDTPDDDSAFPNSLIVDYIKYYTPD